MGKKTVDDSSLLTLADTLREQMGKQDKLVFPVDFVGAVHSVHADAYEEGHKDGKNEEAELCATKHFVHNFVGDGNSTHSFCIPFEPDVIQIFGFDPALFNTPYALAVVICNMAAFGLLGGMTYYGSASGGMANMAYTSTAMRTRYSRTADGIVTIKNIGGTTADVVFATGFPYTAVAVKYVEQTDKERITAFVNRLTGSGKVTLNQAKVNAAFTDDEWAALIAGKPNWTFNWI